MIYVGPVTLQQVQDAQLRGSTPLDAGTADVGVRHASNWHEWLFEFGDIGTITDWTPSTPVSELYGRRIDAMHSGEAGAIDDLASHAYFLQRYHAGESPKPPVLLRETYDRQIHDGAHRIFAAYEFAKSRPTFRLKVYWNYR